MKVYKIKPSERPKDRRFKEYSMLVADDRVWDVIMPEGEGFDGKPYGKKWRKQPFYIEKPLIPRPDFFDAQCATIACNEKARTLAGEALEMSGELLPIRVEGEKADYWLYNVTNCINVLDKKKSKWQKLGPDPDSQILKEPYFIASRFGEESIFKIAEDRGAAIYCVEVSGDPDDGEFKAVVEKYSLTGLIFELVWTVGNQ